ncbi:MAG: tRNA preQ1(34) S-adenosylmethionine ribosyltransferase-isomerase QueA, partial [Acidobacteria bacterium]|nr:tRNA preQ1(34) S-adenosylmethionine ribosyltransferase-isomerase QueA [Acidobacteriota bacterium]
GQSETGAKIEIFLVREIDKLRWEALAKPLRRLAPGKRIFFDEQLTAIVLEKTDDGHLIIALTTDGDFFEVIDRIGKTPLPPYIKRDANAEIKADRERYQTVFARSRGAIAAPTAGLHFTPEILKRLRKIGVQIVEITLHVGYGTFEPVRVKDVRVHKVSPERYSITEEAAATLNRAKSENRLIIAVGTTTTRTLEDNFAKYGRFKAVGEQAELTITPSHDFRAIDGLLTNFHLPKSSLLVLVSTFAGHELIMKAYRHSVASRYRFYSYGDCMLIL